MRDRTLEREALAIALRHGGEPARAEMRALFAREAVTSDDPGEATVGTLWKSLLHHRAIVLCFVGTWLGMDLLQFLAGSTVTNVFGLVMLVGFAVFFWAVGKARRSG